MSDEKISLPTGGGPSAPASSTANAVARYSGTTGKILKSSNVTISDSDDVAGIHNLGTAPAPVNSAYISTLNYDTLNPPVSSALNLISQVNLTEAGDLLFTSIPPDYNHLKVIFASRATSETASAVLFVQFNTDSGSNYLYIHQTSTNVDVTSNASGADFAILLGDTTGFTATANTQGIGEITIPMYKGTTFYKSVDSQASYFSTGGSCTITRTHGVWRSTAAITSIRIFGNLTNLDVGSYAYLYGIN
jgi:hypothetical protein